MPAGSVGKRSGSRGDSWYFRIDLGRDAGGKRQQKTKRGFTTRAAALAAMQDELSRRNAGTYVELSREPLRIYLDRWLEESASSWREATQASSRACVNRVKAQLGDVPLGKLTPLMIQTAYRAMLQTLAPSTVRLTHTTFRNALAQAVKWRLIAFNPANDVTLPAVPTKPVSRWTAEETRRFLQATSDDPNHALWRLLLDAGLRIGEAQALRWCDVDLDHLVVFVKRTMTRSADDREIIGEYPKTAKGRRPVPIQAVTARCLQALRSEQRIRRVKLGPLWKDLDLVFDAGDGRPYWRNTLAQRLYRAAEQAQVPPLTPHGLRHTNATLLSAAGASPKVISERLGHSTVNITLNRYVHPDELAHRQASDLLGKLLGETA